jgi:hypothetical protein
MYLIFFPCFLAFKLKKFDKNLKTQIYLKIEIFCIFIFLSMNYCQPKRYFGHCNANVNLDYVVSLFF